MAPCPPPPRPCSTWRPTTPRPPELQPRARQLGSLVARVTPGTVGLSGFRKQLDTFFGSYIAELQDRGFPIWHPLPFQIPDDREGAFHTDEFLLGDEMLVAPILRARRQAQRLSAARHLDQSGDQRSHDGAADHHGGNQVAAGIRAQRRHRAAGSADGMGLHYFPKLGGEFFLLEGDIAEYSQVHASPALDFMRLEIESKKDRDYQWVVHHVARAGERGIRGDQVRGSRAAYRHRRPHAGSTTRHNEPARPGEGEGRRRLSSSI